jgi:hypothetical protein
MSAPTYKDTEINNIAFIIPTYPPHYHYLYNILPKLVNIINIYLVFSNNEDYKSFIMKDLITPIIVKEPINKNSIITFKKFYALKELISSSFDYFIVCDSEIDIIIENFTKDNIQQKVCNIFSNKILYAGSVDNVDLININKTCASLFPNDLKKLNSITENYTLYSWFSDLPVYRKEDLADFFNKIDYTNIVYTHFDHLIYQFFLLLERGFIITNITKITKLKWSLELLITNDINICDNLLNEGYGFGWCSNTFYNINKYFLKDKSKSFLIYHLDRNLPII